MLSVRVTFTATLNVIKSHFKAVLKSTEMSNLRENVKKEM